MMIGLLSRLKRYGYTAWVLCYVIGILPVSTRIAAAEPVRVAQAPKESKEKPKVKRKKKRRSWKKSRAWKRRQRRARLKRRWRRKHRKTRRQDSAEVKEAKRLNAKARELFMLGKFQQAAELYKKAYAASPHPEFLYNVGQCYSQLDTIKDLERAVFYLTGYLKSSSEEVEAKAVQTEIQELKANIRLMRSEQELQRQRAEAARLQLIVNPDPPPEPPRGSPVYKKWWFWGMLGAIAAGTAVAIVALKPGAVDPVVGTMDPGQVQMP